MACFCCNTTEHFIFLLKYLQRKVDLNATEKLLVFVTRRHRKIHPYVQLLYTNISYICRNTHLRKDAAFLHFRLKKSSENIIFPWNGNIRKLTKIWSFLSFSQIFVGRKFFFSCSGYNGRTKWMHFLIEDYELLGKYNTIWDKVSADTKK